MSLVIRLQSQRVGTIHLRGSGRKTHRRVEIRLRMSVVCTLTRNVGDEWFLVTAEGKEIARMHANSADWRSDLHYVDGEFDLVYEATRERLVVLTCTDGLPLVLTGELARKVPLFEMVLSRDETNIPVPFSMSTVKEVVELAKGEFKTESQVTREVIDYLFPGKEDLPYIPSEPTQKEIDSLLASRGWHSVLDVAAMWYKTNETHNYFLYTVAGEAFGLLLRLLTDWKAVEITQLDKITIKDLSYTQCQFLTHYYNLLGLKDMRDELLALLSRVAEKEPNVAKQYLDWARITWPKRDRMWSNKALTFDMLTPCQRGALGAICSRMGERLL